MALLQGRFKLTVTEVNEWMTNGTQLFYMDVITHPYPNPDAGLFGQSLVPGGKC